MRRALEVDPRSIEARLTVGDIRFLTGKPAAAEAEYKRPLELEPENEALHVKLAGFYQLIGKWPEAEAAYQALAALKLAKNPKLLSAQVLLGMIHEQRKEYDRAKSGYEQALRLDPKFAPAANNLAWILSEEGGNIDLALNYAHTAREQRQDDPDIADTLGWIYYKKNAYLKAATLLKEAAAKLPDNPIIQYHHGMAQQKNGDATGARRSLRASLKLSQTFPGADEARKILKEL